MTIKQLLPFMLIASGLQCMNSSDITQQQSKFSIHNEGEAITSFPDYMYYYSAWSNILSVQGLPVGERATPSLQKAADQILDKYSKKEFINMCAALLVVEATVLQKPFEEFTVEDIQKIQAFLVHNINQYNRNNGIEVAVSRPGKLRTVRMWLDQGIPLEAKDTNILIQIKEKIDLHDEDALELSEFLTAEEYACYTKFFVEAPPAPKIRQHLEDMLAYSKALYMQQAPLAAIAAYIHVKLTQIHPFSDSNGRLARLLMNCLCMKGGKFPSIVTNRMTYGHSIKEADTNISHMRGYAIRSSHRARKAFTNNEAPYSLGTDLHSFDFSSIVWTNEYYQGPFQQILKELKNHCYSQKSTNIPARNLPPKAYQELMHTIATYYEALSPESDDFEQRVGDLKKICLQALSMTERLCTTCAEIELTKKFQVCSRCKKNLYCSIACQKKNWPLHKTTCTTKK